MSDIGCAQNRHMTNIGLLLLLTAVFLFTDVAFNPDQIESQGEEEFESDGNSDHDDDNSDNGM